MGESKDDRLSRIERMLEEFNTQTAELQRLALLVGQPKPTPNKPVKRRVRKQR
jgi:hypothetical protein